VIEDTYNGGDHGSSGDSNDESEKTTEHSIFYEKEMGVDNDSRNQVFD